MRARPPRARAAAPRARAAACRAAARARARSLALRASSALPPACAGDALFQTHENLEHLAMMEAVLGPLPAPLAAAASDAVRDLFKR